MQPNIRKLMFASSSIGLICLAGSAIAGPRIWDDTVSTCTTNNCSSLRIPGTVTNPSSNADPFEIQAFAVSGNCVRFDVISTIPATADLEMVVVAPNGNIYRNDDKNGSLDRKPLVEISSAPNSGWYTVQLSSWNGAAVYADFVMLYGRYPAGNANCASPTSPAAAISIDSDEIKPEIRTDPIPGRGTVPLQ